MILATCVAIGVLSAAGVYLLLRRDLRDVCLGMFLLSHAVNLAIVTAGGSPVGKFPPILGEGHGLDELVDPLPHALVLTAIVIGFAVQAFLLTLLVVTRRRTGSLDVKELGTRL